MKLVANEWKDFTKSVMPKGAPDIQRDVMRKCFYAGASLALKVVGRKADKIQDSIADELEKFMADEIKKSHRQADKTASSSAV